MTRAASPPRFISFEGIDGSGKSTQARRLADSLRAQGVPVAVTREPGGSVGAEQIRRLLVEGEPGRWSPETEILLFTAARRDHLERTIAPALGAGETVICDRFVDSTRAYQGAGRADLRPVVDVLHRAMIGREADLTLLIDVPPALAASRRASRTDAEARFETMGQAYQARVRAEFLAIAAAAPGRVAVIDGSASQDAVAAAVLDRVRAAALPG